MNSCSIVSGKKGPRAIKSPEKHKQEHFYDYINTLGKINITILKDKYSFDRSKTLILFF